MPHSMTIRFGLCLLPVFLATGCTTSSQSVQAPAEVPTVTQTFAMLPDTALVPSGRGVDVVTASYAPASSPDMVRSGSVEVVKVSTNAEVDQLIASYASSYEVPEALVRRVVKRESNFRPGARNGPYWGLMQILPATARSMGYEGPASGLLDAETNLKYAVKYLKGAYLVAGGDHDQAVRHYARGYYFDAKRKGLLEETGLVRRRMPPSAPKTEPENVQPMPGVVIASAAPDARPAQAAATAAQTAPMAERWDDGIAAVKTVPVDTAPVAAAASAAASAAPQAPVAAAAEPVAATAEAQTVAAPAAASEESRSRLALNAPSSSGKGGRVGHSASGGKLR